MLGKLIKEYMEQNGIKQVFVAEKTEIKPQILNAILNGSRKIETVEYFKICVALGVSADYFAKKIGMIKEHEKQTV